MKTTIFHTTGPTDLLHPSTAPHFKTFKVFVISLSTYPSFGTKQCYAKQVAYHYFPHPSKANFLPNIAVFLSNVAEKYTKMQKADFIGITASVTKAII
jgi:hypothetical protein